MSSKFALIAAANSAAQAIQKNYDQRVIDWRIEKMVSTWIRQQ